jgi:cellulose synthase/poly-beta-1,6-N-acetylglucosamine synthase-like glycosyltransferase
MRLLFNPLAGKQRARRPSRKSPRAWGTDQEIADAAYALLTLNPVQSAGYCTRFNLGLVLLCLLFAAYVLLIQNSGNPNFLVLGLFGALGLIFIPALAISVLGPSAINARPLNYVPIVLPNVSLMIPLYREAHILRQLRQSLANISYPHDKLQVLVLVERHDLETQSAFRELVWPQFVQLIVLPAGMPQTKPRALNLGLGHATGDIIGILDAEDVMHPDQIMEAAREFSTGNDALGALQAPLVIRPQTGQALHHLFALEYLIQFYFFLPALDFLHAPIPLSGTSNYFRRSALIEILGWDSFNLTEDADLGIRLYRNGYKIGLLTRPTYECAPENWRDWFFQRTRWFTGHLQTILVHIRQPAVIMRDLGPTNVIITLIVLLGRVFYGPVHTVLIVLVILNPQTVWNDLTQSLGGQFCLLAYIAMLFCLLAGAAIQNRISVVRVAPLLVFYWMAHILPLGFALYHVFRRHYIWYKTPHQAHHEWHPKAEQTVERVKGIEPSS